jgi:hypothetical protein
MRGFAHRMVHPGHLLFEPAVAQPATCPGGLLCRHRDMGNLVVATAPGAHDFCPAVYRRRCVVDIDPSIA